MNKWFALFAILIGGLPVGLPAREAVEKIGPVAKISEVRSVIATLDQQGNRVVLVRIGDQGPDWGSLLVWEPDAKRTAQYYTPKNMPGGWRASFGSVLSRSGHYYYDQNGVVVRFDLHTRKMDLLGKPDPKNDYFIDYCEAPDGTIYMGGNPRAVLVSWSPRSGKFTHHGLMDPREEYVTNVACDRNGTVYCGIGYARVNIVAFDPRTGVKKQILPEALRRRSQECRVWTGEDGYVYAAFDQFRVKLLDGEIVARDVAMPPERAGNSAKFGDRRYSFPDRRGELLRPDFYRRIYQIREPGGELTTRPFDYHSGGADITSITVAPGGTIRVGTAHPLHLIEYAPESGKLIDHGLQPKMTGGNFCAMGTDGKLIYACGYPFGDLWIFDPTAAPRWKSRQKVCGSLPGEWLGRVEAPEGECVALLTPPMLFCRGKRDGATFTFPLEVPEAGAYYLDLLLPQHPLHGTVTIALQHQRHTVTLTGPAKTAEPLRLGPFTLSPGTHRVQITATAAKKGEVPMFGVTGLALSQAPRPELRPIDWEDNPRIVAAWPNIARPRALLVHPDRQHIVISGFPGYGATGGSIGIYDLATGQSSEIADWWPGMSCIALRSLPGGDLTGGTSIMAPGGGHRQQPAAGIFRLDWKNRKTARTVVIPGAKEVYSVELWRGKLYAATNDARLLTLDPETLKIETEQKLPGDTPVFRNALQKTASDHLFLLGRQMIFEIKPDNRIVPREKISGKIGVGGEAFGDSLYFSIDDVNLGRYRIPRQ